MPYEQIETPGVPIKAWIRGVELADNAREQLVRTASLPCVRPHVAVMPDVHLGVGATVGSVIPTVGAIVPAAVGWTSAAACAPCAPRSRPTTCPTA
jgi:tRNA-splicing ligase RtcB